MGETREKINSKGMLEHFALKISSESVPNIAESLKELNFSMKITGGIQGITAAECRSRSQTWTRRSR